MAEPLPALRTAFHVVAGRNEAVGTMTYPRYSARALLVASVTSGTPASIAAYLADLAHGGSYSGRATPLVFGCYISLGPFALVDVEGDHDRVVEFLKSLQPQVSRWPGMDPTHPIMVALRQRAAALAEARQSLPLPYLGNCAVLLYEEEISLYTNKWQTAVVPSLPEREADASLPFADLCARTTAAALRLVSLTHLCSDRGEARIPGTDFSALPSQALIHYFDQLPSYEALKRIVSAAYRSSYEPAADAGLDKAALAAAREPLVGTVIQPSLRFDPRPPFDPAALEPWQKLPAAALGPAGISASSPGPATGVPDTTFSSRLKDYQKEHVDAVGARQRAFLEEAGTIFAADSLLKAEGAAGGQEKASQGRGAEALAADGEDEELFSLDEFILEFIHFAPEGLIEDSTYSVNENWLYANLRHLLKD